MKFEFEKVIPERLCGVILTLGIMGLIGQVILFYVAQHPYYAGFMDCLFKRCSNEMLSEGLFGLNVLVVVLAGIGLLGWNRTYGHLWAWICGEVSTGDGVMAGIREGRKAFRNRYGTAPKLSDENLATLYQQKKVEGFIGAGAIEASRQRQKSPETSEVVADTTILKLCRTISQFPEVDKSIGLEAKWIALQGLTLTPLEKGVYPDEKAILKAYMHWREALKSIHDLTKQAKFAYMVGGLEIASHELLAQTCLRGANTDNQPLQDLWLSILQKLRSAMAKETSRILPWQTWFKEPD